MKFHGFLFESIDGSSRFWLKDARPIIIGRRPPIEPQNIRVASDQVSRHHVRLTTHAEGVMVEDAGSCGGLYLDHERVGGRVPIQPGMRLQLNAELVYTHREFAGESVWDLLGRGPLPVDVALRMAAEVLRALLRLHAADRCHGGLTPHEILRADDGSFTLLVQGWTVITDGVLNCNPAYAAPESIRDGRVEPASDIHALGLIVFEAMSGRRPYPTDTPLAHIRSKLLGPAPQPEPGWSDALRGWLAGLMQVEPGSRPSARQALEGLAGLGASLLQPP